MILETTNPHCFAYKTDELLIELLGGIRIDGLDRMRVTMKVTVINRKHAEYLDSPELAGLSIRHNLDLYNDIQVEKFVRRVAEKLETGSIAITKVIADILTSKFTVNMQIKSQANGLDTTRYEISEQRKIVQKVGSISSSTTLKEDIGIIYLLGQQSGDGKISAQIQNYHHEENGLEMRHDREGYSQYLEALQQIEFAFKLNTQRKPKDLQGYEQLSSTLNQLHTNAKTTSKAFFDPKELNWGKEYILELLANPFQPYSGSEPIVGAIWQADEVIQLLEPVNVLVKYIVTDVNKSITHIQSASAIDTSIQVARGTLLHLTGTLKGEFEVDNQTNLLKSGLVKIELNGNNENALAIKYESAKTIRPVVPGKLKPF